MTQFSLQVEKLKFNKHYVSDNVGYVCLVDVMGDESAIVQAARTSYGNGTKTVSDDTNLIRYLMRHRHTTPIEMVELKFLIYLPIDVMRQHIRHRTASVNEYSTRYSEAIDEARLTNHDEWRLQSQTNKQGSGGYLEDWPEGTQFRYHEEDECWEITVPGLSEPLIHNDSEKPDTPGIFLSSTEQMIHGITRAVYEERLALGVAREQARKDLVLSTYTQAYWKIDLHNLLHYLGLRMDSHAQLEIREYANHMGTIVSQLYPNVWQAFLDYRMNALTFSGPEVEWLKSQFGGVELHPNELPDNIGKRELTELIGKLNRVDVKVTEE